MDEPVLLYVTAPGGKAAAALARALLEDRLIACANVMEGAQSLYWWEGKIEEAREAVMVAKTCAGLVDVAVARIKALHSYACPCVVALPIVGGNADFLNWIKVETRGLP